MERVTLIHGTAPIILVAPHASEESFMAELVQEMAKKSKAYAIINNGFKKCDVVDVVDVIHDMADCNRVDHIHEDVVKDEFLDPLLYIKRNLCRRHPRVNVFYLRGFDPSFETTLGSRIDLILGYGQAVVNSSYICPLWMVDMFINEWEGHGWTSTSACCGKPGGKFSARSINHLPQLFQKHYPDDDVAAMEICTSWRFRQDKGTAAFCGTILSNIVDELAEADFFDETIDKVYI